MAIMDVHRKGNADPAAKAQAIETVFQREGLDPDLPFLSRVGSEKNATPLGSRSHDFSHNDGWPWRDARSR